MIEPNSLAIEKIKLARTKDTKLARLENLYQTRQTLKMNTLATHKIKKQDNTFKSFINTRQEHGFDPK